jgi:Alpha galactosidase A/Alpha galactosidase C-terminal beta sandwich domain
MYLYSALLLGICLPSLSSSLDNGVALTPPMGFNSYMAGEALQNEDGLLRAANFMIQSGLRDLGFRFVNTDEGWEEKNRDSSGNLVWNATLYPNGLPYLIESLHNLKMLFGIYGAASGVTCGEKPGQLYFERIDAMRYASWGVDFLKSDNCASYALDSSVRFRAMRDALNATGKPIVLSIEPFSILPDTSQSSQVSNMWRTGVDIEGTWDAILDRADIADKWAPLAGPKLGWNDPDLLNVNNNLNLGENRVYFGLWSIMKAPLILSTDFLTLDTRILEIITNQDVISINQDKIGIPARKIQIDGNHLPWKVGVEDCAFPENSLLYSRRISRSKVGNHEAGPGNIDTRRWTVIRSGKFSQNVAHYQIRNEATTRCLSQLNGISVVLLPCEANSDQMWSFEKGMTTVTTIINLAVQKALAIPPSMLYSKVHGNDQSSVSDLAYGENGLILVTPFTQDTCTSRWCENYDPEQMWYFSPSEGTFRHSLYLSSMNHIDTNNQNDQDGYRLTTKNPTFRHHCLAHVLSTGNTGSEAGITEVWAGPLAEGKEVVAFLNRGEKEADISIAMDAITSKNGTYLVRNVWASKDLFFVHQNLNLTTTVPGHDMVILCLYPASHRMKQTKVG